jgi:hypothetical protein
MVFNKHIFNLINSYKNPSKDKKAIYVTMYNKLKHALIIIKKPK